MSCPFCLIVAGEAPARIVREWDDTLAIEPLNPVTPGHLLVLPKVHVETLFSSPDVAATTMRRVSEMVHGVERHVDPNDYNVITSAGRAATQTVMHLHVHLVPRRPGDGLRLPWTSAPAIAPSLDDVADLADEHRHPGHKLFVRRAGELVRLDAVTDEHPLTRLEFDLGVEDTWDLLDELLAALDPRRTP